MELTYYGHACFAVKIDGKTLLFDPFISGNPLAASINPDQIEADYILLSHGHVDHLLDCPSIAKRTGAMVIGAYEVINWIAAQGVEKTHPMNIGGRRSFDFGSVKCVNALHSSQLPDGSYGGNPMGFVISGDAGSLYYAGDTGLTLDMKLIAEQYHLDFSVLPIGGNFTMDAEDAAKAAQMVNCNKVVGIHYDTFEPIRINKEEAKAVFDKNGITLLLPSVGETITLK
jgi:L-ascorbate metabolism protein UlaG (beta-lactamase superfamily)